MKAFLQYAGAVVVGLIVGVGSALLVLNSSELLGRFEHDHWFGNENAGSTAAGPYTRAIIARNGLLALNRSETIYFHRHVDDRDAPLREGCAYEISGGDLPTRWWSLTIYAGDDFLPMNDDAAFSIDATQVRRQNDARWTARLTAEREGAENWISTRGAGTFNLALRMYNPTDQARDDPASIPYPKVKFISCQEGAQ